MCDKLWRFCKHSMCNATKIGVPGIFTNTSRATGQSTVPPHQSLGFPKRQTSREIGELTSSKDGDTGSAGELGELLLPGKAPRNKKRTHAWL
jgi:hypothetical protein